jgi:hypothetical protein
MTTGGYIKFLHSIPVGSTLVIDTRPDFKLVEDLAGTNLWMHVLSGSELWPLVRGINSIRVEMADATAESQATISYREEYWSP